jgi:hypothetical protein
MRRVQIAAVGTALCCAGVFGAAGTGTSAQAPCPDHYTLAFSGSFADGAAIDKNGDFLVCAKDPPSSNGHTNSKDDKLPSLVDNIV